MVYKACILIHELLEVCQGSVQHIFAACHSRGRVFIVFCQLGYRTEATQASPVFLK